MTKLLEVYKCNVCGNIVKVVHASGGTLVCCGQPMELLKRKPKTWARKNMSRWLKRPQKGSL